MKSFSCIVQLILRIVLALVFLSLLMDRLCWTGLHGSSGFIWGHRRDFVGYANALKFFLKRPLANMMGLFAPLSEVQFTVCLFLGLKIKYIALVAAVLTFSFGLCMAIFLNIGAPFAYPVFVVTGAALVLSGIGHYKWSIDDCIAEVVNKILSYWYVDWIKECKMLLPTVVGYQAPAEVKFCSSILIVVVY